MIQKYISLTHHEQQAALLLKCSKTTQEACHHGNATSNQEQIGSREGWKGQGERGKLRLREGQPHSNAKQAASSKLFRKCNVKQSQNTKSITMYRA